VEVKYTSEGEIKLAFRNSHVKSIFLKKKKKRNESGKTATLIPPQPYRFIGAANSMSAIA
jgi:hypothetical protein